jgi:hypothetical protein
MDIIGERRLWGSVLANGILESLGNVTNNGDSDKYSRMKKETIARQANIWIERNSGDFRLVCELAGVDPSYIRRKYFEEGYKLLDNIKSSAALK